MKSEVSYILYAQAGLATVIFLLMLFYFPEAPPSPPSASASTSRPLFKESLRRIFKSKERILTGVAFACITVPMMWIAVANQNLHPLGLSQRDTGYIQATIVGIAVCMNLSNSYLSDLFSGRLKTFICTFLSISLVAAVWLALICFKVAPFSVPAVYASSIVCMVSLRCIIALFYELLMEVHYPVPESLASLAWGQAGRLLSAIFLGMFSLEEAGIVEGVSWMNYFLVIFIALPLVLLMMVKVTYNRMERDKSGELSN